MNPNETQVGGQHYRDKNPSYQHWDYVAEYDLNYFAGQVTKYITRWKSKDGVKDVQKAIHYLDKLMWLLENGKLEMPPKRNYTMEKALGITKFTREANLDVVETEVFLYMSYYDCMGDLAYARHILEQLLTQAVGNKDLKVP